MNPIFSRGPSLQLRLFLAIVCAIALIITDTRMGLFVQVRSYLDTFMTPIRYLANGPKATLDVVSQNLITRDQMIEQNQALRQELILKNSDLLLLGQLKQENARLRALLGSPVRKEEHKMIAQVLSVGTDPFSDQVMIDKGSSEGVYIGQPVINDKGVVGQVVAVSNNSSRVLLICNPAHALPIQVLRNDIRVIAAGNGCTEDLQLEYLPLNSDIQVGDILVTSGLGGRFPEGYPVAVVSSVTQDNQRGYTVIKARPTAGLQRLRYLLLLWQPQHDDDQHPMSPAKVHQMAQERLLQMLPQAVSGKMKPEGVNE
ncbi:MAG: rod shape-determining protein MreC [Enterobacteriaceae bacterium]